jgi:hypothetical protein
MATLPGSFGGGRGRQRAPRSWQPRRYPRPRRWSPKIGEQDVGRLVNGSSSDNVDLEEVPHGLGGTHDALLCTSAASFAFSRD